MIVEWSLCYVVIRGSCLSSRAVRVDFKVSTSGPLVYCSESPRAKSRSYALDAPDQPNRTGWFRGALNDLMNNFEIFGNSFYLFQNRQFRLKQFTVEKRPGVGETRRQWLSANVIGK